jgi:YidC/Oxa1 family membrane protein insertase
MTYIMPFFALTGLYWPFGLVLYWVTTNVWTLGQQWLLGMRYPYTPPAAATDAGAVPSAATARSLTGGASKSTTARPGQGKPAAARPGQGGSAAARAQQGGSQQSGSRTTRTTANGASANGNAQGGATAGSMLKRLGRRSEPEPQAELPDVKLVRHQTQRQSRSKRSGKR